jgi:type IV secretion system protein VirD4
MASNGAIDDEDPTGSEKRHQPELIRTAPADRKTPMENEFEIDPADDEPDDAARNSRMDRLMQGLARQVSPDSNVGMEL